MHGPCSISWGLNGSQLVQLPLYDKILAANLNIFNLESQDVEICTFAIQAIAAQITSLQLHLQEEPQEHPHSRWIWHV